MYPPKWTLRALVIAAGVVAAVAVAPRAAAQPNPFRNPAGLGPQPLFPGQPRPPAFFPQAPINAPGIPFNPDPFGVNPRLNPVQFVPVNPWAPNPFFANPFLVNPFVNNPFNPFNNQLANNPFAPNPLINPFANPFAPAVFSTPAVAVQQPGFFQRVGPNLAVNPWSGTAVAPFTGVAQTADGNLYFRLGRDGTPTVFNPAAPRTNVYFSPASGSFLNPNTGVIVRPGGTSVFLPWTPPTP